MNGSTIFLSKREGGSACMHAVLLKGSNIQNQASRQESKRGNSKSRRSIDSEMLF